MFNIFLRRLILLSTPLLFLIACEPTYTPPAMTATETQRIKTITEDMSPRCVGRYVVDLPKSFVLNPEYTASIKGIDILIKPMSRSAFEQRFAALKLKFETKKIPGEPYFVLSSTLPLPGNSVGGIFDRHSDRGIIRASRTLELRSWKSGYEIHVQTEATDGTYPELLADPTRSDKTSEVPEKLATLLSVYERVRGRAENEIPTDAGICIANGFIKGAPDPKDQDSVTLSYELKDSLDVFFNIQSLTTVSEKTTMLERSGKIEKGMKEVGAQTIRKGKRQLASIKTEEWLLKGPGADQVDGTMFQLRANETSTSVDEPYFNIEFKNGFRIPHRDTLLMSEEEIERLKLNDSLVKASLSPAEAIAIWDKITATLRPR